MFFHFKSILTVKNRGRNVKSPARRALRLACAACFIFPLTLAGQGFKWKTKRLPSALNEVSGMAFLKNDPANEDLFLLNDGGNPPVLFRLNLLKDSLSRIKLPLRNHDWEDLTADSLGNLYIGDFGNNYNRRRDLRVYIFNPATGQLDSLLFNYSDQTTFPPPKRGDWNFDCEAMVFFHDSLHLFSKNAFGGNFFTKHYVLPARPGQYTAVLRDSFHLPGQVVTGAAVSSDGQMLALTTYFYGLKLGLAPVSRAALFLFEGFSGSDFFRGKLGRRKLAKHLLARQAESVVFLAGKTWLVANERLLWTKAAIRKITLK